MERWSLNKQHSIVSVLRGAQEELSLSVVRGGGKALPSEIIGAHKSVREEEADPKVSIYEGTPGKCGTSEKGHSPTGSNYPSPTEVLGLC